MQRSSASWFVLTLGLLFAAPAGVSANSIAGALGNLRWGMSVREVKTALRSRIKDKSAQQALESSYVEFNKPTRWDHTPVSEEYTQGNEESMLSYNDSDGTENYFFFIGGQLWKWVKYYPASAFGGRDFDRFSEKVQSHFGHGYSKEGEVNPGSGQRYKFMEFGDRNTRLRAVDKTKAQGKYSLMFESMDTVRSLSALRSNSPRRSGKSTAVASADDDSERSAPRSQSQPSRLLTPAANAGSIASNAKQKKSIFSDEQQSGGDDPQSYQAKKQRVQAEARDRQRRNYEREQDAKKGKALDSLAGVDDSDPISGMP